MTRDQINGDFMLMPSKQDDSSDVEKACTIVANNVDLSPLDEDLELIFTKIGRVLSIKINSDNTAEIVMGSEKEALFAVEKYNGIPLDGILFECALKGKES